MKKFPLISIITPSFNQGKFVAETIDSVLSQNGDFYLEYIIIDGGSVDESVDIIRRYELKLKDNEYPIRCKGIEFKWVSEKDEGLYDAVNKGFRLAKGEIIGWLNSDDTYYSETISRVVDCFMKDPKLNLVYGDCNYVCEGKLLSVFKGVGFNFKLLKRGNCAAQPAVFYRLNLIQSVGLVDTNLKFAADYDFFIKIAKENPKVKFIPFALSIFRIHPESKTTNLLTLWQVENLLITRKYFGSRLFIKRFRRAFDFFLKRGWVIEDICEGLETMFQSRKEYKLISGLKKDIEKGIAYAQLCAIHNFVFNDPIKARKEIKLILKKAPCLLIARESFKIWIKALLGEKHCCLIKKLPGF